MQVILSTNPNSSALSILITYRHLFAPDLSPPLEAEIWARLADTSSHVFSWQLKVRVVKIELRILFPHSVSWFLQTPPFSCSSRRLAAQVSSAQNGPSWQFPLFWASLSVSCHEKLNSIFLGEVWAGSAPEPSWQHGSTKTNETGRNMQWGVLSTTACALIITVSVPTSGSFPPPKQLQRWNSLVPHLAPAPSLKNAWPRTMCSGPAELSPGCCCKRCALELLWPQLPILHSLHELPSSGISSTERSLRFQMVLALQPSCQSRQPLLKHPVT